MSDPLSAASPETRPEAIRELIDAIKALKDALSPSAMADIPVIVRMRLDLAMAHALKTAPAPEAETRLEATLLVSCREFVTKWDALYPAPTSRDLFKNRGIMEQAVFDAMQPIREALISAAPTPEAVREPEIVCSRCAQPILDNGDIVCVDCAPEAVPQPQSAQLLDYERLDDDTLLLWPEDQE